MGIVKSFINYHLKNAAIKPLQWIIIDMRTYEFQASCPYCYSTNFVLFDDPIFYCVYCGKRVKSNYSLIKDKEPKGVFFESNSYDVPTWIVTDYDQHRMFTTLMCSCCGEKSIKMTPYSKWDYCGKCGISIYNPDESVVGVSKQINNILDKKEKSFIKVKKK